ncbi:3-ketoacyl-CoA reductase [Cristinia sonorae]|uniref:Very-long-chain 3-oxoacyl-CoA reductase n=1 Tax=Cristinia sonorae TaxID=1940300 RepID=A0A8K0UUK0_9AGAR|nr:3-ketoacyl-CoA reductase [Cristinia sonorae]
MASQLFSFLPVQFAPASNVLVTDHPYLLGFLLAIGSFSFARFLLKTTLVFLQTFVLSGKDLRKYGAGKGAWAVVTGASEGIGREFALQLAQKGFNVLVSARNATALSNLVAEIESKSPQGKKVETKSLVMDFSKLNDAAAWSHFESEVKKLDVGVLINNVGRSHSHPVDFADTPIDEMDNILNINVNATAHVTRIVVPHMIAKKRGLVISIGSFSGVSVVSPMLAVYSGTKSWLSTWSAALGEELKSKNIDVMCTNTYFVVSNLSKIRRPSLTTPTPKAYVRSVLSKVGLPCGALWTGRPYVVTPYWSHAVIDWFMNVVGWKAQYGRFTHNLHRDILRRVKRKQEREAKAAKSQ